MTAGFWVQVLAEVLASCPVFAAGLLLSHRAARRRLDEVTRAQTEKIAGITRAQTGDIRAIADEQTSEITGGLLPGFPGGPPGEYHGHEGQGRS